MGKIDKRVKSRGFKMKKIISVIIVMFTFNTSALASQFCDGFSMLKAYRGW
jgi:hypothetical protein